jgi:hypothetical protein
MAAGTFTVAGERVRTSSTRRFVAWKVRRKFDGVRYTDEIASRDIFARSDSVSTVRTRIQRYGFHSSEFFVVIDTATGDTV